MTSKRLCIVLLIALILTANGALAVNDDILADNLVTQDESGELVALIQKRLHELGYFLFKPTGNFQSMTKSAVIAFQTFQEDENGTPFIADGTVGPQSLSKLFSPSAVRAPIAAEVRIPIGKEYDSSQTQTGAPTPWVDVKAMLVEGESYTLTDYNTGATFNMIYTGGAQHAHVECAGSGDTDKFKQVFGGEFSFFKRPMLISVGGNLIACSLQGRPHGDSIVNSNDMPGHACLYFTDSRSHVGGLSDVEHRENVTIATGTPQ